MGSCWVSKWFISRRSWWQLLFTGQTWRVEVEVSTQAISFCCCWKNFHWSVYTNSQKHTITSWPAHMFISRLAHPNLSVHSRAWEGGSGRVSEWVRAGIGPFKYQWVNFYGKAVMSTGGEMQHGSIILCPRPFIRCPFLSDAGPQPRTCLADSFCFYSLQSKF